MTTTEPDPGDGVEIRRVERADLLDVVRIERASFPQPWPYGAFTRFVDEPGFLVAVDRDPGVAMADGTAIAGYVVADTTPNHGRPFGHVKDFAVHPDRRGRGIGTRLLDRALAVLAAQGADRVKLEVREGNDAARSLYEGFGFVARRVLPRYYDDGEDALVLVAELGDR